MGWTLIILPIIVVMALCVAMYPPAIVIFVPVMLLFFLGGTVGAPDGRGDED